MQGQARSLSGGQQTDPFVARLGRFVDLAPADLSNLHDIIRQELTVRKRRDLVVDGYEFGNLCFVMDGFAVRYKLLRNGKRQIVNLVLPGDVIGLPGSFVERARFSVVTVTDMKLQVCALDDFVALCYRQPKFGLVLAWLGIEESLTYASHIVNIGRRTPAERLAHVLVELHARLSTVGRAGPHAFDLPFSQEVLSDALGLSVPHLNRMLARLRKDRLITVDGRLITFIDRKALELLGHYQPLELRRVPPPGNHSRTGASLRAK